MAKYVCPACKKILIRSADDIRLSGSAVLLRGDRGKCEIDPAETGKAAGGVAALRKAN
jgi:hypothetical protein